MAVFTFGYLILMAASTAVYLFIPVRLRQGWLTLSGLLFALFLLPSAVPWLLIFILMNFLLGRTIIQSGSRQAMLAAGISANVIWLVLYRLFESHPAVIQIGALFLALQGISYLIEIRRGQLFKEMGFLQLSSYFLFFPRLAAGLLMKPQHFITSVKDTVGFEKRRLIEGGMFVLWGVFQKTVIADRLGILSAAALSDTSQHFGWELIVGAICFTLQLYFDLAAYTDIAFGFAHMMGFRMAHTVNHPFAADRPFQFWSNYMVSLSNWVRDYMAVPLKRLTGTSSGIHTSWRAAASVPFVCTVLLVAGTVHAGFLILGIAATLSIAGSKSARSGADQPLLLPFASRWLVWVSACAGSLFLAFHDWHSVLLFIEHVPQQLSLNHVENVIDNLGIGTMDFILALCAIVIAISVGYGRFGFKDPYPFTVIRILEYKRWKQWTLYYLFVILLLLLGLFKPTPFLFGF